MDKQQAQNSIKRIQVEASQLETSALVTLFEIDISTQLENLNIPFSQDETIFRFHNNTKLVNTDIVYKDEHYILCPIEASGFEYTSQGSLPTPLLRITVSDIGISLLALLKNKIKYIGDLTGCKVTRRRTFAKFLSNENFNANNIPSDRFIDELAEMPPDIWFINRKSNENKILIEYELNSVLDLQNIQLPHRPMYANRCPFDYRGVGCFYEYNANRNDDVHGELSILPEQAPPIATEDDKLITDILHINSISVLGAYQPGLTYNKGQSVYIENFGIKYHFVCKSNGVTSRPPNRNDWIADKCSKCLRGCKLRWAASNPIGSAIVGNSGLIKGELPFGGFLGLDRIAR